MLNGQCEMVSALLLDPRQSIHSIPSPTTGVLPGSRSCLGFLVCSAIRMHWRIDGKTKLDGFEKQKAFRLPIGQTLIVLQSNWPIQLDTIRLAGTTEKASFIFWAHLSLTGFSGDCFLLLMSASCCSFSLHFKADIFSSNVHAGSRKVENINWYKMVYIINHKWTINCVKIRSGLFVFDNDASWSSEATFEKRFNFSEHQTINNFVNRTAS